MDNKELFQSLWDEGEELYDEKPIEAIAKYLEALEIEEDPNLLVDIGECYFRQLKNPQEAEQYFQRAEEGLLKIQTTTDAIDDKYYNIAFYNYEYKKDYEKSLKFAEIALKLYSNYVWTMLLIVNNNFALGKNESALDMLFNLYQNNKNFEEAKELYAKYNDEIINIAEKKLSKSELRTFYWDIGFNNHYSNTEKAIMLYKKAVEIEEHPHLFTNLGHAYYKLKDYKEAEHYFTLAEKELLTKAPEDAKNALIDITTFLYEYKKNFKKAIKYFEEALKLDSKDEEVLDLGARLYFATNNKNEALKFLAKQSRVNQDGEVSKDLFVTYEKELNEYIENYWKNNDKKKTVEKILKELKENGDIEEEAYKYITGKLKKIPQSNYFYYADNVLQEFYENFVPFDDEYMVKIYDLGFDYSGNDVVNFFTDIFKATEENYKKIIDYCFLSKVDKLKIINGFIDSIYYIGAEDEVKKPLKEGETVDEYAANIPAFLSVIKKILIPDYLKEIAKGLKDNEFGDTEKYFYSKLLLEYDYKKYEDAVKDIFTKQYYSTNLNQILFLIKDEKFIKDTIVQKVELFIDNYGTKVKNLPAVHKEVNDYLMKGVKSASFDDTLTGYVNKMPNYSTYFYSYNLHNLKFDEKDEFYKRLLQLALKLDRDITIETIITNTFGENFTFEDIINKLKEFDVTLEEYTQSIVSKCVSYFSTYYTYTKVYLLLLETQYDLLYSVAKKGDAKTQQFLVKHLWEKDKEKTYPLLLEFALATSKSLRKEVINILSKLPEKTEDFRKLLTVKKQAGRETGIRLLTKLKVENIDTLLKELYEKETSDSMKNVLNECMMEVSKDKVVKTTEIVDGMIVENIENNMFTKEKILKSAETFKMKGSKEPVAGVSFLSVSTLPKLLWQDDSTEVSLEVLYFFIHSFARTKSALPSYEGKQLGLFFEEKSLKEFTNAVFERWNEDSKTKWVFGIISAFGGNEFVKPLKDKIKEYVDYGRGAMAAIMVESMAMIGSSVALQTVDYISRKEKHKQVKNAAIEALETAAKELNLSKDELLDKIIPSFNFSKEGTLELDFGPRKFTLKLTAELELSILDSTGKTIKALPKPGKDDDEAKANEATQLYKDIKKEVKEQAKLQKERLESGLAKNRLWKKPEWIELFTENPMMKLFGVGLIWGIYQNNELIKTFRFQEDGSFSDINDDSFKLNENALIGMIHPIELSKEDLATWKQQLIDYEIKQPFNQLDRTVKIFDEEQLKLKSINDFEGFMVTRGNLKSKFSKLGWENGPVEDAGCFYSYRKYIHDYNMYVDIGFLGDYMGSYEDLSKEVPVYGATFYKKGTYESIILKEIPTRLLSEIYNDLKTITDSGSGFNPEWKKVSW